MKKLVYLLLLGALYTGQALSGTAGRDSSADYDKVCAYFNQLQNNIAGEAMTPEKRGEFINDHVRKYLDENSHARELWEVVAFAVPEERYEMFTTTVSEQIGRPWSCEFMRKLISTAGK